MYVFFRTDQNLIGPVGGFPRAPVTFCAYSSRCIFFEISIKF